MGRDKALKAAYAGMATRLENRATMPKSTTDTKNNPLVATLCTTGGGKSFFLDELGALHKRDLNLCENLELRDILKNSVSPIIKGRN